MIMNTLPTHTIISQNTQAHKEKIKKETLTGKERLKIKMKTHFYFQLSPGTVF